MPNSKSNNAVKARVFHNLKRDFLNSQGKLKALLCGKTVSRGMAAERQTDKEMDDTTVDNDVSAFNYAICSHN